MSELTVVALDQRAVLRIGGADRIVFLQNLVSGDVGRVEEGRSIWSALLTPQGKYLFDFFLYPQAETILLDAEAGRVADLARRLTLYRLRAKVTIELASDLKVSALLGEKAAELSGLPLSPGACRLLEDGVAVVDPRLGKLGVRLVLPEASALPSAEPGPFAAWDRRRLALGVPDGTRDLIVDKTTLLEAGFDELGGIGFEKGCYVGQELTARMKYRGLLKKRLFPVGIFGAPPLPGTPVRGPSGSEVGEMRSSCGDLGLALLRLDSLVGPLTAGESRLEVRRPAWLAVT